LGNLHSDLVKKNWGLVLKLIRFPSFSVLNQNRIFWFGLKNFELDKSEAN
jgi:hypothetical protein